MGGEEAIVVDASSFRANGVGDLQPIFHENMEDLGTPLALAREGHEAVVSTRWFAFLGWGCRSSCRCARNLPRNRVPLVGAHLAEGSRAVGAPVTGEGR